MSEIDTDQCHFVMPFTGPTTAVSSPHPRNTAMCVPGGRALRGSFSSPTACTQHRQSVA